MPQKIVVFLGPSLPHEEASRILEADYLPPAKRGDILKAAGDGAEIIGLIDGVFFQDCSVAHREILAVLQQGIKMIGASSMGALRASEMDTFGMEGVGEIYRMYRSGEVESDDEVALSFDPLSFQPLSEPLINIRYNIERAEDRGILTPEEGETLLKAAQSLYFPKRTYPSVIRAAEGKVQRDSLERFRTFLETDYVDLKREDAILALKRIKEIARI
ncbi:MAG TPA: TfuA-related McrA-glycine thioamidation protein [Methanomicrobiales archaeon]|nr:TfuA-related McrA-glycine thioamidation protein [Methanomicrobiales archaeon]